MDREVDIHILRLIIDKYFLFFSILLNCLVLLEIKYKYLYYINNVGTRYIYIVEFSLLGT